MQKNLFGQFSPHLINWAGTDTKKLSHFAYESGPIKINGPKHIRPFQLFNPVHVINWCKNTQRILTNFQVSVPVQLIIPLPQIIISVIQSTNKGLFVVSGASRSQKILILQCLERCCDQMYYICNVWEQPNPNKSLQKVPWVRFDEKMSISLLILT